jgi:WhiB family redox-sensing transcriptional regulator
VSAPRKVDYAAVSKMLADGVPQRQIMKDLGIARSTLCRIRDLDGTIPAPGPSEASKAWKSGVTDQQRAWNQRRIPGERAEPPAVFTRVELPDARPRDVPAPKPEPTRRPQPTVNRQPGTDMSFMDDGLCLQVDPEMFYPEGKGTGDARYAKQVCAGCDVRKACLEWALTTGQAFGVWGGASPNDRRRMRRDGAA